MVAELTGAADHPAPQDGDRCPYSRSFGPAFSDDPACPAYQAASFAVTDTAGRALRSATTCRHLAVGQDPERAGRFYPRCGLGSTANRIRWVAKISPGRLAVMRALEEEFAERTGDDRLQLIEAKARLLASDALDARQVEALEVQLSSFLDLVDGLVAARAASLIDLGLPPDRLTELAHDWSLAWLRSAQVFGPAVADLSATRFPAPVAAYFGAAVVESAVPPGEVIAHAGRLEIERSVAPATIRLRGDIDVANSDALATAVGSMLARGGEVTVDFTEVLFCDVSGLRAVVSALAAAGKDQRVNVVGLPGHLRRALTLVGWTELPGLVIAANSDGVAGETTRSSG